jgi:hypothetical protein
MDNNFDIVSFILWRVLQGYVRAVWYVPTYSVVSVDIKSLTLAIGKIYTLRMIPGVTTLRLKQVPAIATQLHRQCGPSLATALAAKLRRAALRLEGLSASLTM